MSTSVYTHPYFELHSTLWGSRGGDGWKDLVKTSSVCVPGLFSGRSEEVFTLRYIELSMFGMTGKMVVRDDYPRIASTVEETYATFDMNRWTRSLLIYGQHEHSMLG